MIEEIKKEALEQIVTNVKFGFENEDQSFENIIDMFEEETLDESWLRQTITCHYSKHLKESALWAYPTDFNRLAKAFEELLQERIVCLHNAGYTSSDGEGDCMEVISQLEQLGIKAIGYCYYHTQDLMRAIDPESCNLFLGFDSSDQDDSNALKVANKIIEKLKDHGFEIRWPGTVDHRIEIVTIDWKKVRDDRDWGGERVIELLANSGKSKKPFWKFW